MTYIQPLVLVLLVITAVGLFRMRKCKGVRLSAIGLIGLFLVSWPPMDWLLSRPLETWYVPRDLSTESAQAIVVLSSSVTPQQDGVPYSLPDKEMYERCEFAAWLHTHGHSVPILATGGPRTAGEQPLSETMRQLLQRAGVAESMIWSESRSSSTHENAAFSAEILKQHGIDRIILVTDAQDMLRAERAFRKEGLVVIPVPCAYRELGSAGDELIPSWKAIYRNERTLHESVGLLWYWLRGWI
jgi:uncharacterized SAM-binding protein YcdF (DUF218 family)